MVAGVINIYSGLVLFVIGLICLAIYFLSERKINRRLALKKAGISLAILIVNFPVATAALFGASYLLSMSTLLVKNETGFTIRDLTLIERDKVYEFPVIEPNEHISKNYNFKYEGAVMYKLSLNEVTHDGIVFGYVTSNSGGKAEMLISGEGAITVDRMKSNE